LAINKILFFVDIIPIVFKCSLKKRVGKVNNLIGKEEAKTFDGALKTINDTI
jgi:hypothetical protein